MWTQSLDFCHYSCPAGHYCPDADTIIPCGDAKYYCVPGFPPTERIPVPKGSFSTAQSRINRTGHERCPEGTYCVNGIKYDCGGAEFWCGFEGQDQPIPVSSGYFTIPENGSVEAAINASQHAYRSSVASSGRMATQWSAQKRRRLYDVRSRPWSRKYLL